MSRSARGGTAAVLLVALFPAPGAGQADSPPLAYWQHTAWVGERGPPIPGSYTPLESADGYLWLAAPSGLVRFDGVRFFVVDSTTSPAFQLSAPGEFVPRQLDRQGVMWVSGPQGQLLRYQDGEFRTVLEPATNRRSLVREDGAGRLWLTLPTIARLVEGRILPHGLPPGTPDTGLTGVVRDRRDGLWIGTNTRGLWHLQGDLVRQHGSGSARPLVESRDGTLWAIGGGQGLIRVEAGRLVPVRFPDRPDTPILARAASEGLDGSVWFASQGLGLIRWRDGRLEQFTRRDGLSSVNAQSVHVDRAGAVWVSTDAGLDRLRSTPFIPIEQRHGFPFESGYLFAEDASGFLWASAPVTSELYRLDGGVIRGRTGPITATAVPHSRTERLQLLTDAADGGVWVAPIGGGLAHVHTDHTLWYGREAGVPADRILTGWESRDGALWVNSIGGAFGRLRKGRFRIIPIGGTDRPGVAAHAVDRTDRVLVSARNTPGVTVIVGDSVAGVIRLEGDSTQLVQDLAPEGGDTVWASLRTGLHRIIGTVSIRVPVPGVARLLEPGAELLAAGGYLWVASAFGIAYIPLAALHRTADGESTVPSPVLLDPADGLSTASIPALIPRALRAGRDGRVWISTASGLGVADPAVLSATAPPIRIRIEEVTADGRTFRMANGETIPPNPDRVTLRFTATGALVPERVRLEYRLDGAEAHWSDGAPLRLATYTQLRPGRYTFRVRAWNHHGVPSADEATLSFRVLPAWYQSWWFLALCVLAVAGAGSAGAVALHRGRTRRAAARMESRYEAALAERTRIARELHDTLLQGFTGITLELEGVRGRMPPGPGSPAEDLGRILHLADTTLREAREMVWDMRAPELADHDLGGALETAARHALRAETVALSCRVHGTPRRLSPALETTVLRVGREAVVNALKHAHPSQVLLDLTYEPHRITLEVRDDGHGADPAALEQATSGGHWGIAGMRERALRAGGSLTVVTAPGEGMQVTLALPAEPLTAV